MSRQRPILTTERLMKEREYVTPSVIIEDVDDAESTKGQFAQTPLTGKLNEASNGRMKTTVVGPNVSNTFQKMAEGNQNEIKTTEGVKECDRNKISEMRKRGKDRDDLAKKHIHDFKLNLEKQRNKVVKQLGREQTQIGFSMGDMPLNASALLPSQQTQQQQQQDANNRNASVANGAGIIGLNFMNNLPTLSKVSSAKHEYIQKLTVKAPTMAMDVEVSQTPNFQESPLYADESSYIPIREDTSMSARPSYAPAQEEVSRETTTPHIDLQLLKEHDDNMNQYF